MLHYSESGWATGNVIIEFIEWLHPEVIDSKPSTLVLDVFPSHETEWFIDAAEEKGVGLPFVAAGGNGGVQPMDRRIFGELKVRA
jgi:hypothetical protein